MMMRYVFVLVLSLWATAAMAKPPAAVESESLAPLGQKAAPATPAPAGAKEEAEPITPEQQALLICQTADIMGEKLQGAEYVPGVDAYGNPVADADVYNSMPFTVPDQIEVPINIDVMAALGVTSPAVEGKANFGTLTVYKGGRLEYNGRDITNTIEGYCREHMKKMEEKKP